MRTSRMQDTIIMHGPSYMLYYKLATPEMRTLRLIKILKTVTSVDCLTAAIG